MMTKKTKPRIAVFDDSKDALRRFAGKFENTEVELQMFRNPLLNDYHLKTLKEFKPDIIVVSLIMGGFREDGYNLIRDIRKSGVCKDASFVVCSKLINSSELGHKEKKQCTHTPGVVAAFSKFPDYPSADQILVYIK
jgi:response regulator RpfG family c-di-GMP phosphodiesterase